MIMIILRYKNYAKIFENFFEEFRELFDILVFFYQCENFQVDHFKPRSPTKHPMTSHAAHSQPIHSQPTHSQLTHHHHDYQNQHHYHHKTSEMDVIVPPTQYEKG